MIRVYIDWNAFSRLDDNDEVYKKASSLLIDDTKYIIPFSHAHLLDIHRSYLKVGMDGINSKLEILEKYSKGLLITDTDKDELEFMNIYVKSAMNIHIENYDNYKALNITAENLLESFEILKPLFNFPISNPIKVSPEGTNDKEYQKQIKSTRSSKEIEKLFGDSDTTSMSEFMKNFIYMSSTLYETDDYSNIRNAYQKDLKVNTGRMRDNRFDPIESLNENARKMSLENFIELHERLLSNKDNLSLFKQIHELCRLLDFNGFFSDIIKQGHHLDNIETDFQHIGYASTCDVFISADNNTRERAKLAFKLLHLDVKVFTPKEFVEFTERNSYELENGEQFLDYLTWLVNTTPDFVGDEFSYYFVPSYILEYFNTVCHPNNDGQYLIFHKFGSPNRIVTFIKEISSVRDTLLKLYGKPILESNEIGNSFYGICWLTEDLISIKLIYKNKMLILEIQKLKKMKGWKRIWHRCKQNWNFLLSKIKMNNKIKNETK